jgi:hypothetical protein
LSDITVLLLQDPTTGLKMVAYDLEIKEFMADAGFTGTECAGPVIPTMGYAVAGEAPTAPGPLIFSEMCARPHLLDPTITLCPSVQSAVNGPSGSDQWRQDVTGLTWHCVF